MIKYKPTNNKVVYNFDLDGRLCEDLNTDRPIPHVIDLLRKLYYNGQIIIIWTARQWEEAPEVVAFLHKNKIPFHGLYMSKGGSDSYIDDKMITIEELEELCKEFE